MNATTSTAIQSVFVLVLENRSFDHMLGFSAITGIDAVSGQRRTIDGVVSTETNIYQGKSYLVSHPADYAMPADPGHEFMDVLVQLAGEECVIPARGSLLSDQQQWFCGQLRGQHQPQAHAGGPG